MVMRFESGQVIPKNVLDALRYLGKVGVMGNKTWNEFFSRGGVRWKQKQLLKLSKKKLIVPHSCERLSKSWVLSDTSKVLLTKLKWPCVTPVPSLYVDHDEIVANGIMRLERAGICNRWTTERELKMVNSHDYIVHKNKEGDVKFPDAIIRIMHKGKERTFAIEYERNGKSLGRYRSILWQYSTLTSISLVLFVVENDVIKKRILQASKYIGSSLLAGKLAFMDVDEWEKNLLSASIDLGDRSISFNEIDSKKFA